MNPLFLIPLPLLPGTPTVAATYETFYQCYGLDNAPKTGVKVDPNSKPQTIGTANGAKVEMFAESADVVTLKVTDGKLIVFTKSNNGPIHLRIENDKKIATIDCPKMTVAK